MIDIRTRLSVKQFADFEEYRAVRYAAMKNGTHYLQRLQASREYISPIEDDNVVLFEDPNKPNDPVKIMVPSGRCLAELMHGGIHPLIEDHLNAKYLMVAANGYHEVVRRVDACDWIKLHGSLSRQYVVDYRGCHQRTADPMSLEQAIEYLIMKDIPQAVWGQKHNRQMFCIAKRGSLPKSRQYRNAWQLNNEGIHEELSA